MSRIVTLECLMISVILWGMGRTSHSTRDKADELKSVSTSWLKQNGYEFKQGIYRTGTITWSRGLSDSKSSIGILVNTTFDNSFITFSYTQTNGYTGEKKEYEYNVQLVTTPCNFGGVRYWYICPLVSNGVPCNRRVGTLYLGGAYFGCRHCYDLTYSSRCLPSRPDLRLLVKMFNRERRIEELAKKVKRYTYKGTETRLYMKYLSLIRM